MGTFALFGTLRVFGLLVGFWHVRAGGGDQTLSYPLTR